MHTLLHTTYACIQRPKWIHSTLLGRRTVDAGQRVPAMNRQPAVTAGPQPAGPQPHTTGLDETFAPDGKGKKRAAAKAEPVRAGPVWATVTVTDKKMDQNPEVE